jgi:mono/diheme cytochrome c family protein
VARARPRGLAWIGTGLLIASLLGAVADVRPAESADGLPDGKGKQILNAFCIICHESTEITKFRGYYDRKQWRDVVVTMKEYGAPLDAEQIDALADYLEQSLGKRKPPG